MFYSKLLGLMKEKWTNKATEKRKKERKHSKEDDEEKERSQKAIMPVSFSEEPIKLFSAIQCSPRRLYPH